MSGALTTDPIRLPGVPTDAPPSAAAAGADVPPELASDEQLAARSRRGDRAAFEQLVRRTARAVYARQYLEVGDPHRAEDLAQETFLLAWRSIGQLADPAGFRPWLLSIARSVATDAYRRDARKKRGAGGRREDFTVATETASDPAATPHEAAEREERRRRVAGALKSLPEEYSLPLTLRYVAGADYETIGRQLGLSNGSLRGLLSRGLAKLREKLKDLR
jgi:RNA polymerase sigma-70 factor (ECF subfamily)